MRRRQPLEEAGPPARLLAYDPADWPAPECHPECAFWAAVQAWREAHPDADLATFGGPDAPWHPELL